MSTAIRRMTLKTARISDRTRWLFVEIERVDGRVGTGEATLAGREEAVVDAAARMASTLGSTGSHDRSALLQAAMPATLEEAAAASAIDTALWDLEAQESQSRLVDALGGAKRATVPIYANINRRTKDRSPEGFAHSLHDALLAGFDALKIAPFDEVTTEACASGQGAAAMRAGLARVAAAREAAGPARRLMVDCHWRFDEATAAQLIEAVAEYALHWIECPLPETTANIPALVRLRNRATAHGIRLAGMEQGIGFAGFRPFCEAGCYDVMMPDVKYVGGLRQMLRCADEFARYGIEISPHNPSGPVAHAASLHASAAMSAFDMLELQFDESPLFHGLVGGALPELADGVSAVPAAPGLGVRLTADVLAACLDGPPRIVEPT